MQINILFDYLHNTIFDKALMEKAKIIDSNANGIQIQGSNTVKKIALGVSCNAEFLQKAINWQADTCIFHHGLSFSNIINSQVDYSTQKRLALIIKNNLTIAGYHYVLDTHPEIGNNAQIIEKLGANKIEPYFGEWGYIAEFNQPRFVQEIAKDCSTLFKHDVFMVLAEEDKIKRIGVCSGGAKPHSSELSEIISKGVKLHITGEISESSSALAKELGFSYFACGHYATEIFGITALGNKIKQQFPEIEIQFIDVWNEV